MAGRHVTTKRRRIRRIMLGVVVVLLAALVAGAVIIRNGNAPAAAGCADAKTVSVTVSPEIEPLVDAAAKRVSAKECLEYAITPQPSAVAANTIGVSGKAPDLWLPDSSAWFGRSAAAKGQSAKPAVVTPSVASSPAVVVSQSSDRREPSTWLDVLNSQSLRFGDALTSAVAALPLVAAQIETKNDDAKKQKVTTSFVALAQRNGVSGTEPPSDDDLVRQVSIFGGTAIVSEQLFVRATGDLGANIAATAPSSGTLMLDYPLAATRASSANERAGKLLSAELTGSTGSTAAAKLGFRDPASDALADDKGIGNVQTLPMKGTSLVDSTLKRWSTLALPTRALAVIDVSGSMQAREPSGTRIGLTVQAALTGIGVFPDSASMGMWAFSVDLGGPGKDWKSLAPIEQLDKADGTRTHREELQAVSKSLPSLVKGGTGLYDTALASFREVKQGYDPQAVNSVIILSDGQNEDSNSVSLKNLLATLRSEQDRNRPVVIITIGIGTEADADVLKKIAGATGGSSYVAERPQDIPNVFVKALQSRLTS